MELKDEKCEEKWNMVNKKKYTPTIVNLYGK
jgi:hypothetical protein